MGTNDFNCDPFDDDYCEFCDSVLDLQGNCPICKDDNDDDDHSIVTSRHSFSF